LPIEGLSLTDLILDLPTVTIAEQLTIIDYDLYSRIQVSFQENEKKRDQFIVLKKI
jgi:hypothetical protein